MIGELLKAGLFCAIALFASIACVAMIVVPTGIIVILVRRIARSNTGSYIASVICSND